MEIKKTSEVTYGEIREFPIEDPCYSKISLAWTTVTTPDSDTKIVQALQVKLVEKGGSPMPDTYLHLSFSDVEALHSVFGEYIEAAQKVCSGCDQPLSDGQICRYCAPEIDYRDRDNIPF